MSDWKIIAEATTRSHPVKRWWWNVKHYASQWYIKHESQIILAVLCVLVGALLTFGVIIAQATMTDCAFSIDRQTFGGC